VRASGRPALGVGLFPTGTAGFFSVTCTLTRGPNLRVESQSVRFPSTICNSAGSEASSVSARGPLTSMTVTRYFSSTAHSGSPREPHPWCSLRVVPRWR